MSLIDAFMTPCCFMDKQRTPDGEGGFITSYKEGAKLEAAIVLDQSLAARVAEKEGVKNLYTITTRKTVTLEFHDVIKRLSDGAYFRITSDGTDKSSPNIQNSLLDIRQVTAERWELTS